MDNTSNGHKLMLKFSQKEVLNAAAAIAKHFSNSKRNYALGLCIAISFAFVALFVMKVSSVTYTLKLLTSGFTARLAQAPALGSFAMPPGFLVSRIDGLSQLKNGTKSFGDEAPINVVFDPPQAALSAIDLWPGSTLTIATFVAQGAIITVRPADRSYNFRLTSDAGKVSILGRNGESTSLSIVDGRPVILDAEIAPRAGAATVYVTPANIQSRCDVDNDPNFYEPNIEHLLLSDIHFARTTEALASSTTSSTIISGVLRFPTIDREIPLERADAIRLGVRQADLTFMRILPCGISLQLKGLAESVDLGSLTAMRDIRPTYLEVAIRDKDIAFVLSAVVSIWGFFWGLRELVVKPNKESEL
jgi:hypothetical protein